MRPVVPLSTLAGGFGIAVSGLSDSYPLTLASGAISGIGVAAYHPESATAGTVALFVLYAGGTAGSLLGGSLAHRWNRVTVSRRSYALAAVAMAGAVWIPGQAMYLFVTLTSIGLYVPFSLQVTLGQDYLPSRVGTASGITLGLAVSVGGLASSVIGAVADATSLQTALAPLVAMPLLSWALYGTLSDPSDTPTSAR